MNIHWNPTCRMFRNWLRRNKGIYFNKQLVCSDLGLDISEWENLYQCLLYWRKKFKEFYKIQDEKGLLQGDRFQKWLLALRNFEVNYDIQPFYYEKGMNEYYVPHLADKEKISHQRILQWIKSSETIAEEMKIFDESMFITGKKH